MVPVLVSVTIAIEDEFKILFADKMPNRKDWNYILTATFSKHKSLLLKVAAAVSILACLLIALLVILASTSEDASEENKPSGIVIIGGYDHSIAGQHVTFEFYHPNPTSSNNYWADRFANLSFFHSRASHVAALINNKIIYATGASPGNATEILDLESFVIEKGPSLRQPRKDAAGAVYQDSLVICGGRWWEPLSSCERLIGDKWHTFTALPEAEQGLQMASVDGRLFSLGGLYVWTNPSANLHEWMPEGGRWVRRADMMIGRAYFAATAYNQSIVACGSHLQWPPFSTASCEVYDITTNRWQYMASMNEQRAQMSLVVFEEVLYVLGGSVQKYFDGALRYMSYASVEQYVNGSWSFATDMKTHRGAIAVVALENY